MLRELTVMLQVCCSSRDEIKALQKELASAEKLLAMPSLGGIDGGRKAQMRVESLKDRIRSAAQAQASAGARSALISPLPLAVGGSENGPAVPLQPLKDSGRLWQGSASQRKQPLQEVRNVNDAASAQQGSTGWSPGGDHIYLSDD